MLSLRELDDPQARARAPYLLALLALYFDELKAEMVNVDVPHTGLQAHGRRGSGKAELKHHLLPRREVSACSEQDARSAQPDVYHASCEHRGSGCGQHFDLHRQVGSKTRKAARYLPTRIGRVVTRCH